MPYQGTGKVFPLRRMNIALHCTELTAFLKHDGAADLPDDLEVVRVRQLPAGELKIECLSNSFPVVLEGHLVPTTGLRWRE